ncbi:hypothetical protein D6C00_01845 [Thiohalobacter thiocyanaticus]|uniref:Uncharacterized protein n=1 Tax=Thiohalobacter thiocyanaticus TaxID=585455 RepID=A0A426QGF7_9GAMM|nr:hypothetical protein D6C00_01845 [Thiohalobacter thiocyanaticus]
MASADHCQLCGRAGPGRPAQTIPVRTLRKLFQNPIAILFTGMPQPGQVIAQGVGQIAGLAQFAQTLAA